MVLTKTIKCYFHSIYQKFEICIVDDEWAGNEDGNYDDFKTLDDAVQHYLRLGWKYCYQRPIAGHHPRSVEVVLRKL